MTDIFIAYSSEDQLQALELAGKLRAHGYEIWMSVGKISGAMNWSSEIVEAINSASTLVFLISSRSVASSNCAKEVHLASEKQKNILPILIEDVKLPPNFEYALAGLQWVNFEDDVAIFNALEKLKTGKLAVPAANNSGASFVDPSGRLRLAVLPFDDLSPTRDNEWFADGMMDELINTLGALDQIRVNPRNDVIYYKGKQPRLAEIANDLKVRYVVSGSVQKAGERIRIRVSLSDAQKHAQVWSEKYDATFDDIFDLQDRTCHAITEALRIQLAPSQAIQIEKRPTSSPEAYEYFLKADEFLKQYTKIAFERAIDLYKEAIRLDPNFVTAISKLAHLYINYYSFYAQTEGILDNARALIRQLEEVGATEDLLWLSATLHLRQGNFEVARNEIEQAIANNPLDRKLYSMAGIIYSELGLFDKTIEAFAQDIRFNENDRFAYSNYIAALEQAGYYDRTEEPAKRAVKVFERHLRLYPDDVATNASFVNILRCAGRHEEALELADRMLDEKKADGILLFDLLSFYTKEKNTAKMLEVIARLVDQKFPGLTEHLRSPEFDILRDMAEFKALME
jgi:adenylate cyclase